MSEAQLGDPAPLTRRWPAEWEAHRATWLSWPHNMETWPGGLGPVEDAFCEIVRAILPDEAVEINVSDTAMAERVRTLLAGARVGDLGGVRFHVVPTNDAWVRDHGGVFVEEKPSRVSGGACDQVVVDFAFDAWGGKYPPWDLDAAVAAQMAEIRGLRHVECGYVLEAGSVDGDGHGTILTTESCLLNPNRDRPGQDRSRQGLESMLGEMLGATAVLWLKDGIEGDDTDGHVDDLTRFVAPGRVVTVVENDRDDSNFVALEENRRRLEAMRDTAGRALEVIPLPTPGRVEGPLGRVPGSYANFYLCNRSLLLPVYGVDQDREAIDILSTVVQDREVIPIPSQNLVLGLGAVHCLTQQEPLLAAGAAKGKAGAS